MAEPTGLTVYPTATDMSNFLIASGFDPTVLAVSLGGESDLEGAAQMGITQFEEQTSRIPMLASGAQVRFFDPPTGPNLIVSLRSDFVRCASWNTSQTNADLITALTAPGSPAAWAGYATAIENAGTTVQGIAVIINGQLNIELQDYWVKPYNVPLTNKPYTWIEFSAYKWPLRWQFALPQWMQSIMVVSGWGYGYSLPQSCFRAMLKLGAASLIENLPTSQLAQLISMEQTGVSEKWSGDMSAANRTDRWRREAETVINNFRRAASWVG